MTVAQARPTMLSGCAYAVTTAEARHRVQDFRPLERQARVIAVDRVAEDIVRRAAEQPWNRARFLRYEPAAVPSAANGAPVDPALVAMDGSRTGAQDEFEGVDVVVMVATADDGAEIMRSIGATCSRRAITTAGLVVGRGAASAAVAALRPYTQVLLVSEEVDDLSALLVALRA